VIDGGFGRRFFWRDLCRPSTTSSRRSSRERRSVHRRPPAPSDLAGSERSRAGAPISSDCSGWWRPRSTINTPLGSTTPVNGFNAVPAWSRACRWPSRSCSAQERYCTNARWQRAWLTSRIEQRLGQTTAATVRATR